LSWTDLNSSLVEQLEAASAAAGMVKTR
jgi:hypothetical protein